MAGSVMGYFANDTNRAIVERLRGYGLQMQTATAEGEGSSDILAGKSIVISGVFTHHSRDEYKALIERNGGKNVGSISGKTSFILAGDNMGPSKLQKAEKLGVAIVDEDTFLKMISEADTTETATTEAPAPQAESAPTQQAEASAQQTENTPTPKKNGGEQLLLFED